MFRRVNAQAFETYRARFWEITGVAAVILIPAGALTVLLRRLVDDIPWDGEIADLILGTAQIALSSIGYFLIAGLITEMVVSHRQDRPRRKLGATALAIPYAALIVIDLLLSGAITVGLQLLVIPGLFIAARFGLAPVVIEITECGVRESLRRSFRLSSRYGLAVLSILVGVITFTTLLSIPFKLLTKQFLPSDPAEILALVLAGILIKPMGAVIEVVLTLELMDRHREPEDASPAPAP